MLLKSMAITYTTAPVAEWEDELRSIDNELDLEYYLECRKEYEKFNNESMKLDQILDLWDDMSKVERFGRFYHKRPDETKWDNPHFMLDDPLGLFTDIVDLQTFERLRDNVFKIDETNYRPSGSLSLHMREIWSLFRFAERYVVIKDLYPDEQRKRKKFTIWIVSQMMEFLL